MNDLNSPALSAAAAEASAIFGNPTTETGSPIQPGTVQIAGPAVPAERLWRKRPVEAITFDELVAYGLAHCGPHQHNGMPWSFSYKGHPITHENDGCYLIPTLEGPMGMTRRHMLITGVKGEIYPCDIEIFEATYEPAGIVPIPHEPTPDAEPAGPNPYLPPEYADRLATEPTTDRPIKVRRVITTHHDGGINDHVILEAVGGVTPGNANYEYFVRAELADQPQKDSRWVNLPFVTPDQAGLTIEVLLAVLIDRLEGFQAGPFPCQENHQALSKCRHALSYLKARTARLAAEAQAPN